jgi:hypothetical protein
MEGRSRSESPRTVFVNSVLIQEKYGMNYTVLMHTSIFNANINRILYR